MPSKDERMQNKRATFISRLRMIVPKFKLDMLRGRIQSVRINTIKSDATRPDPIEWAPNCYWLQGDKAELSHSEEAETGRLYIQNAASFIPPLVLDPKPQERILDMCAAPGGKSSHIAAITNNKAELWVNDNSKTRLNRMIANFARLGVKAQNTTMYSIDTLKRQLPEKYFDKILLDAPCSGEGMIDIDDPKALDHWSVAHIRRLQRIQKKAIVTAWDLLKPGGTLVYSTCTLAPEENEAVVDYLLRKREGSALLPIDLSLPNRIKPLSAWNNKTFANDLSACLRLAPSPQIEAFFVAHIRKPKS